MYREKILVVDDDKEIVSFCVQVLEDEGYEVKGVNNGQSAIDFAQKDHYDLLVTDIMMPGLSGMHIFQTIKKFDPELVGIVITGHGTLYTAIDALKIGFHGFITKPFKFKELTSAVSQALERSRLEKEVIAYRRVEKLKDDFLAVVSHELRTPLSLILSSVEHMCNIRREKADEDEKSTLNVLKREGNRLAILISNILLFFELKFKKVDYPKETIDMKNIIAKVLDSLKEKACEKNITIKNRIPSTIPKLRGVNHYMKQLIFNFLDNAIQFNQRGGGITFKARKKGQNIQFEISDTGIGIAEEDYARIFNAFQQLEEPLTRKVGGPGLGLAINKEIVESHGGEIWVESTAQKGTKFIFTLPICGKNNKQ